MHLLISVPATRYDSINDVMIDLFDDLIQQTKDDKYFRRSGRVIVVALLLIRLMLFIGKQD